MDDKYYTAGEIARIAGVSLRTIRYYDAKGLLPPVSHSDTGYRLYDKGSLSLLQRILMLKYLGFSLEEIQKLVAAQEADCLLYTSPRPGGGRPGSGSHSGPSEEAVAGTPAAA